jgi:hypothetical protein
MNMFSVQGNLHNERVYFFTYECGNERVCSFLRWFSPIKYEYQMWGRFLLSNIVKLGGRLSMFGGELKSFLWVGIKVRMTCSNYSNKWTRNRSCWCHH